jgi:hypothetical protein
LKFRGSLLHLRLRQKQRTGLGIPEQNLGLVFEAVLHDQSVRHTQLLQGESMPPTVVIAQDDPGIAQGLANDLHVHFSGVKVVESALELRTLLLRHPEVRMAVLDLEVVNLEEVRQLVRTFDDLTVVCTHHSPDNRMWTTALDAGAVEFCHPDDIRSIVRAQRAN